MSALSGEWSVEKIREVMRYLDQKTGLRGAELPIRLGTAQYHLGSYNCTEGHMRFSFSARFLNDPLFRESEAIELIRHEYAHYYVHAADLRRFFLDGRSWHHGPSWKYACRMVGASGRRAYDAKDPKTLLPELTEAECSARFRAEDVRAFDILGYVRMWNQLPPKPEQYKRWMAAVEQYPEKMFFPGDEVLSGKYGFGRVLATDVAPVGQMLCVEFCSGKREVLRASWVYKVVNGELRAMGAAIR